MSGRGGFPYRRLLVALTIVASASCALSSTSTTAATTQSLAGHWRIMYYLRCSNAVHYAAACAMAAQVKLPVADEKNATFVTQRTLDIISDARGRFTFQSRVTTIEQAPGSNERCHSYMEETGTLPGICEMVSHGKGHIARGQTGLPDFWMEQRTTVYHGHRDYQITRSTVLDTLTPATPGSWDTARLVNLHGYPAAPPGFDFRVSIQHDPLFTTGSVT
jgi:hypothetical protein